MKNCEFVEFSKNIVEYYNESYNQYNDEYEKGFSDNNRVLSNALDNFNELCVYYNLIQNSQILNAFKDSYGEQTLKPQSVEKLLNWLKEEDILFLFEQDFEISTGCEYYLDKQSFLHYTEQEPCEELGYFLDGKTLTDLQKNKIENLIDSYIDNEKEYLYIHSVSFNFKLPKKAILAAYKEHKKDC